MAEAPARRRLLYGRRQGHRLRAAQQEALGLLPRLGVLPEGGAAPLPPGTLDPKILFPDARAVWLEIGFGGGEHLLAQAEAHPDIGMIGCEPFVNGVAKLLRQIEQRRLGNVRVHAGDARDVLDALAERALGRVFVLFPDPWPKARHHKRRIIAAPVLDQLARVMAEGAELRIATDIAEYARWTLLHVLNHGAFAWPVQSPRDWRERPADWPPTRYEEKALQAGRRPVYLRFVRRGEPYQPERQSASASASARMSRE